MKKKILSIVVTVLMVFAMMPMSVSADTSLSGDGTLENPYKVGNYTELQKFATIVNNGETSACAELTKEIECTGDDWVPIGDSNNKYTGTFNGNGHTINELSNESNGEGADCQGLFGYIAGGIVMNVGLKDGEIVGQNYVGGLAGRNDGGTIENCYNTGAVSCTIEHAGGLVGRSDSGTIESCYNTGKVSCETNYAGGLVGVNRNNGVITNCYNSGAVSCGGSEAGGLVGYNDKTINNCYNTGAVSCDGSHTGGLVGANNNNGKITNCYNTGAVSCGGSEAGGVAGDNNAGVISNCYNTGAVSCDDSYAGGVVGTNQRGTNTNCYYDTNFCTVSKAVGNAYDTDNVKGLDTFQMTGERAAENSTMGSLFVDEDTWLKRSDGVYASTGEYCLYYPHLKGFAGWPTKVTVDAKWNGSDSYTYKGISQKPTVKTVTISNGSDTVPAEDYTLKYFIQIGEDPGTATGIDNPLGAGRYKAVVTFTADGNEGIEKGFEIKPAKLTITANDQTLVYNGEMQGPGDMAYADPDEIAEMVTVNGLQGKDKLTGIQVDGQGQKIGTYELMPSSALINDDADAINNYDVTYAPGTLTIKEKQDPEPTPTPEPSPAKISGTLLAKITVQGKRGLVLKWNKINGAEGYDIFFARCNNNGKETACKKVKTVKGNKTFKWTRSGLKKGKAYKAYVKAWVMKDGKKSYVKTCPTVHAYTSGGNKNYTNAKSVTVNKTSVSLKAGKTFKIKADVTKLNKGKTLMPSWHAPKLRYISSNKKIATVSKGGKITAKGAGKCKVYVIAVNGVRKTVAVTVK